jgi:hypothetical protein
MPRNIERAMVFSELDSAIAVIANPIKNLRIVELGVLAVTTRIHGPRWPMYATVGEYLVGAGLVAIVRLQFVSREHVGSLWVTAHGLLMLRATGWVRRW